MKSSQQDKLARRIAMAKEFDIKDVMLKPDSITTYINAMVKRKDDGICPICEQLVDKTKIVDELSIREFKISGLCQSCQDNTFGVTP
jgi:hypothetical protein